MLVKVNAEGQIALPKEPGKSPDVEPGDTIALTDMGDHAQPTPVNITLFDLIGSIPVDGPIDFDAIREQTRQYVAEQVMKGLEHG